MKPWDEAAFLDEKHRRNQEEMNMWEEDEQDRRDRMRHYEIIIKALEDEMHLQQKRFRNLRNIP